jgi:phospholipid/cholesterol/gamma-HCH transport system permease protein
VNRETLRTQIIYFFESIGSRVGEVLSEFGGIFLIFLKATYYAVIPPYRPAVLLKQMEFIGAQSTFIISLTGLFTGMVFALQSSHAFKLFGAENLIGPSVALSLTRELGPVLTALMVTGRAGSAIAAELGTMRVTEQIDALYSMAVNPVQYLIVPRVIGAVLMLPLLTGLFDFLGILGSYLLGVYVLGLNPQDFMDRVIYLVDFDDLYMGLVKSMCFGAIIAVVSCYKGFFTTGGAEGVGRAATQSVVISSVAILIGDYILTALMF